jgi:hypothetical protein
VFCRSKYWYVVWPPDTVTPGSRSSQFLFTALTSMSASTMCASLRAVTVVTARASNAYWSAGLAGLPDFAQASVRMTMAFFESQAIVGGLASVVDSVGTISRKGWPSDVPGHVTASGLQACAAAATLFATLSTDRPPDAASKPFV